MLKLPNYAITRKLGRGSYGEVYLASRKGSDTLVAIKCIPKTKLNKRAQDNLISEISILQKLRHPHVVRLMDFSWDSERVYLFMEYCAGGDLSHFIRLKRYLPEQLVRKFLRQLALALQYLRKKNIIHMDLKPQNILLTSNSNPVLKVTDFGFAQNNSETVKTNELRGTLLYMAPEIYCEGIYHPSCDLWSVGVILYECLFGSPPYASCDTQTLKTKLASNQAIELPSFISISADCVALLRGLLKRDPNERMSHEEFFAHPFVDLKHAPSAESLDKALEYLEHAVEVEKRGDLKQAHENYTRGLAQLVSAIEYESSPAERAELRQLAVRYFEQAEKVKKQLIQQRPHRPPPPASVSRVKEKQNKLLPGEDLPNSGEPVIRPTQVAVQGSPKSSSQFAQERNVREITVAGTPGSASLYTAPFDQTDSGGSSSYIGGLFNRFRQLWVGETKAHTTDDVSERSNTESSSPDTGGVSNVGVTSRTAQSEQIVASSTSTRPTRPPAPAYLDTQRWRNQATKDPMKESNEGAHKLESSVSCGHHIPSEVASQGPNLHTDTVPSISARRPLSTSQVEGSLHSDANEWRRSNPPESVSSNVADISPVDLIDLTGSNHVQKYSQASASALTKDHTNGDDTEPRDPSRAAMVRSVSTTERASSSLLFNSVPSNLTQPDVDQFVGAPTYASVSLRNSLITGAHDSCDPEKLARLRQLAIGLTRHGSNPSQESIELPDKPTLPEIPTQQMALLMDTERLCELESLCGAADKKYLLLVDHLKEFYDLFRSNQYNEAFQYFQSNFGTLLKTAKADTNETRRRAFMRELKVVLDLVEGSQQQRKGKTEPNVTADDPCLSTSRELSAEAAEDSVPQDQCSPS